MYDRERSDALRDLSTRMNLGRSVLRGVAHARVRRREKHRGNGFYRYCCRSRRLRQGRDRTETCTEAKMEEVAVDEEEERRTKSSVLLRSRDRGIPRALSRLRLPFAFISLHCTVRLSVLCSHLFFLSFVYPSSLSYDISGHSFLSNHIISSIFVTVLTRCAIDLKN